jgi:hypothetical protein
MGQPGGSHLDRLAIPSAAQPTEIAEVALERLRLAAAVAVDEAWARRASGHRDDAIAALAEVRGAITAARDKNLAPPGQLNLILDEIAGAEGALAGAAREAERFRRAAREKSHVTLLGHSVVKPVPSDDD